MKGKRMPNQQSSQGAAPAGELASCMLRFKTRPTWLSRWLCASKQGGGVLAEANQGPGRQIYPLSSYLSSCNQGVYCSKKQINTNPTLDSVIRKLLKVFRTTWVCKSIFSSINFMKHKYQTSISNQHLIPKLCIL